MLAYTTVINDADAIVVGSGPSGVSVAFPLVESGMRVIVLDGGRERDERLVPHGAYHDVRRRDSEQWRLFLGQELEALRPTGPPSPKFRAPSSRFATEGFAAEISVVGRDFEVTGSLAIGGFSAIWGAGLGLYDAEDLAGFPLGPPDLAASYRRIARRMGVSGFVPDDLATDLDAEIGGQPPLPLAENARRVLARYEGRRAALERLGLRIGRPRIAVLSQPFAGRGKCELCDACLWGCRHGAIWSASYDLATLAAHPNLEHRPGVVVERIESSGAGWHVVAGGGVTLRAPRVVLAAGTLVSTRLALQLEGRYDEPIPLLCSPTAAFALCLPERIGRAISTREFSMSQLSFTAREGGDRAYGNLFAASGVPAALLIEHMPLTRPGAVRLLRLLQPALLLGNCFLPGRHDHHEARLERDSRGRDRLVVQGSVDPASDLRLRALGVRIGRAFRRLGAFMLPRSFTRAAPGSDLRYAGTLPMRQSPRRGEVDLGGQLAGHAGLHVVDLSIFPVMGAKHPTLTLMANADRIGRLIAGLP